MRRQNFTYSDEQSGRLQRARTTRSVPIASADATSVPLPAVGETIHLDGHHGTCEVLGHESGPGGITMVGFRCTTAGSRTTPGDRFKLSEPLVRRIIAENRQHTTDQQIARLFGEISHDLAKLEPRAWLPFVRWLQVVTPTELPPSEEPPESHGFISECRALHRRVLRGFSAQPEQAEPAITYTVTLRRAAVAVTDTLPMEELRRVATAIHAETNDGATWRRYRHFASDSVVRSAEISRRLVQYVVEHQQRWLRTGKLLHQQRLARSSPALLRACDVEQQTVNALAASIGDIRVGKRDIDFEDLFTASDFERERVVTVLTERLTALGYRDLKHLTLQRERELVTLTDHVLNEGMPVHLCRPISHDRFRRYLRIAIARATPTPDAIAAAERAWTEEGKTIQTLLAKHRWIVEVAAATFGISEAQLFRYIHTRHAGDGLADAILEERRAFVLRLYHIAVPGAATKDNMQYAGIRAVANALGVESSARVAPNQHVEDWVRDALCAADAPNAESIPADRAATVLRAHGGNPYYAAQELGIRIATMHLLIKKHRLVSLLDQRW